MEERAFNLCREPWICVLDRDYRVKKVSLSEALTQSSRYLALAGETETQNIAVLRLLLALLHTVFYRQDEMSPLRLQLHAQPAYKERQLSGVLDLRQQEEKEGG